MYCIVNLETRNILATRQGDILQYANERAAGNGADFAQQQTNCPHCTYPVADIRTDTWFNFNSRRRELAPWLE
jgi:ribosomal protein L37E